MSMRVAARRFRRLEFHKCYAQLKRFWWKLLWQKLLKLLTRIEKYQYVGLIVKKKVCFIEKYLFVSVLNIVSID